MREGAPPGCANSAAGAIALALPTPSRAATTNDVLPIVELLVSIG
jgi:hypothetical protein